MANCYTCNNKLLILHKDSKFYSGCVNCDDMYEVPMDIVPVSWHKKYVIEQPTTKPPIEPRGNRYTILARDGFMCSYCRESPLVNKIQLHVDHIIPKSAGGSNYASNLTASCKKCNLSKNRKQLDHNVLNRVLLEVKKRNKCARIHENTMIK